MTSSSAWVVSVTSEAAWLRVSTVRDGGLHATEHK